MQQPGGSPGFSPLLPTIVHACNILSATQKNTENVVFWWKSLKTKIYVVFISSFFMVFGAQMSGWGNPIGTFGPDEFSMVPPSFGNSCCDG